MNVDPFSDDHNYRIETFQMYEGMHLIEPVDWLKERGYKVAVIPSHVYTTCGEGDDIDKWIVGDVALLARNLHGDATIIFCSDKLFHNIQTHPDGRVYTWLSSGPEETPKT